MKRAILLTFLAISFSICSLHLACGQKEQPMAPSGPAVTFTPTATIPMGIYVKSQIQASGDYYDITSIADISVNQQPEPSDLVVLSIPNGNPITLTYSSSPEPGVGLFIFSGAPSGGPPGYQVGGSYSMSISTSIGTVSSAAVIGPGGSLTLDPSGSTASWANEGNADHLVVLKSTQTYGSTPLYGSYYAVVANDINSPFTIPNSAYPGWGTYYVYVWPTNLTTVFSGTPGVASGSYFTVSDLGQFTVTK